MGVRVRTVSAGRGWAWLAGGAFLYARSPLQWTALILILYAGKKLLHGFPVAALAAVFSVVAVLLMPVFLAGLMDGCHAVATGGRLKVTHLLQGFRRNAGNLVTLGGISLVGNLVVLMVIAGIGGEAMTMMGKIMASGGASGAAAGDMKAASNTVAKAALVGAMLSLPLLMALWFAPLLAYFDDMRPLPAMKASLVACLRNILPMMLYSAVVIAGLVVLMPVGMRLREFDLGLWLMAPVLVPSIYVSYRDIFVPVDAAEPTASTPGPAA